jgi:hypothetical protein
MFRLTTLGYSSCPTRFRFVHTCYLFVHDMCTQRHQSCYYGIMFELRIVDMWTEEICPLASILYGPGV